MKNIRENVMFLSGQGNPQLAIEILKELTELSGQPCELDHININTYPDSEKDDRIVKYAYINGKIVIYFQSLTDQDKWVETEDITFAVKHQYGAQHLISVNPFFWNRRQDPMMNESERDELSLKKPLKPDEIQRLRKSIFLLKQCGVDEMLTATPHSNATARYCDMYGIKYHEIDVSALFTSKILTFVPAQHRDNIYVYSPDIGSVKRALGVARMLKCPVLFNEKNRPLYNTITLVETNKGERETVENQLRGYYKYNDLHYATQELVNGKVIVMIEDEIASGATANKTAINLKEYNPLMILFFGSHAVLTPGWRNLLLQNDPFTKIIMTNTIHRGYNKRTGGKITDISVAPLFASNLFQILDDLLK